MRRASLPRRRRDSRHEVRKRKGKIVVRNLGEFPCVPEVPRRRMMQEPCKSCDRRHQDFGGCRCQAMLLAGDAAATDPVCSLAPTRGKVDAILATVNQPTPAILEEKPTYLYRPNSS